MVEGAVFDKLGLVEGGFKLAIHDVNRAELLTPTGNAVLLIGKVKIPFVQVLVDRTNDNNPVSINEIKQLIDPEKTKTNNSCLAYLHIIRDEFRKYDLLIEHLPKCKSEPRRYFLCEVPVEKRVPKISISSILAAYNSPDHKGLVVQFRYRHTRTTW